MTMEKQSTSAGTAERRSHALRDECRSKRSAGRQSVARAATSRPGLSLIVGAKTLAGIGLGLVAVITGAAVVGALSEAILVPSLLLKMAGGVAGGGVGMAKGLKDARKLNRA
jgi:hypothetical protein